MRASFWTAILAVTLVLGITVPTVSFAQGPTVINVLRIDPSGDLEFFLGIVKRARAINERLGTRGKSRVWQATLAGEGAGAVYVAIEHPSLVTMAQGLAKLQADAE